MEAQEAVKRSRWDDSEEFAVEVPPADWEDRVSFSLTFCSTSVSLSY
jgi:hypothetical protein